MAQQNRVPKPIPAFVTFMTTHGPKFKLNAVALGMTVAQGTAYDSLASKVRTAYDARNAAEQAFKNAVLTLKAACDEGRTMTGNLIRIIDGFASNAPDPTVVYTLADIAPPSSPTPVGSPGKPSDFVVGLDETGALNLSWKCANPPGCTGVIYEVRRRVGPTGAFGYIGASGTRTFVDDTLPAGSATVTYQLTAIRSTARGPAAQFTVNFGIEGGGGFAITSISEQGEASGKMAA